jgi:hypothetical protein
MTVRYGTRPVVKSLSREHFLRVEFYSAVAYYEHLLKAKEEFFHY